MCLVKVDINAHWDFKGVPEQSEFAVEQVEIGERLVDDEVEALAQIEPTSVG